MLDGVKMPIKPRRYCVTVGLLYPSALGAALAWLVPAVPAAIRSHGQSPTWWTLSFAVLFLLYHGTWFCPSRSEGGGERCVLLRRMGFRLRPHRHSCGPVGVLGAWSRVCGVLPQLSLRRVRCEDFSGRRTPTRQASLL